MGFGGDDFFGGPMSLGQFGYMAEAEGQDDLIDTPDAQFNAALNDIRTELAWARGTDYDATHVINGILYNHNINPSKLTSNQLSRIRKAIS